MTDDHLAGNMSSATRDEVRGLLAQLESDDAATRLEARSKLSQVGAAAAEGLRTCLYDPQQHVRWEAAKTLVTIADPHAAAALVHALDDEDQDVRWVAGEALIALGEAGIPALLMGLIRHSGSGDFLRAAHHVLHDLAQKHANVALQEVLDAIDGAEPAVAVPPTALTVLRSLTIDGDA